MVLHVFLSWSITHAHNRRCSVQKGGSEGKVVRRWSSRPCWERWPVPGLPAPAWHSPLQPLSFCSLTFPLRPLHLLGFIPKLGRKTGTRHIKSHLSQIGNYTMVWITVVKLWSELIGTVLCFRYQVKYQTNICIYKQLHIIINLCHILPKKGIKNIKCVISVPLGAPIHLMLKQPIKWVSVCSNTGRPFGTLDFCESVQCW